MCFALFTELSKDIFLKNNVSNLLIFYLRTAVERKIFLVADQRCCFAANTNPKPQPETTDDGTGTSPQPCHCSLHAFLHSGAGDTAPPPRPRTRPRAARATARRASRTPSRVVFAVSDLARQRAPCEGTTTASRSSSLASRRARRGTARQEARREPAPCRRLCLPRRRPHQTHQNLTSFVIYYFSSSQDSTHSSLSCLPECPPSAAPPQHRAHPRPSGSQLAQGAQVCVVPSNRSTNSGGTEKYFTSFRSCSSAAGPSPAFLDALRALSSLGTTLVRAPVVPSSYRAPQDRGLTVFVLYFLIVKFKWGDRKGEARGAGQRGRP